VEEIAKFFSKCDQRLSVAAHDACSNLQIHQGKEEMSKHPITKRPK